MTALQHVSLSLSFNIRAREKEIHVILVAKKNTESVTFRRHAFCFERVGPILFSGAYDNIFATIEAVASGQTNAESEPAPLTSGELAEAVRDEPVDFKEGR